MTKRISRRRFIQLGALTGTAVAVSGCTINLQQSEMLVPYVVPPEEALPGDNVWYATACRMCSAGCGIMVRLTNGRAHKIEGNPEHPLNAGKSCARGQSGLQYLYNPERFRNALRNEARGGGGGSVDPFGQRYGLKATAIPWDDALAQVTNRIKSARPGGVAFYSSNINDMLSAVVTPFLQALGSPAPVFYDTENAYAGRTTLTQLVDQYFAQQGTPGSTPFFHLSDSDVVFAFGGPLVDGGLSIVAYNRSFGEMRGQALGKRGYLVQFEPCMSPMGAVADEWVPILPGTEGAVALAIGRIMVDQKIGNAATSPVAGFFSSGDANTAASLSGIAPQRLVQLARTFGSYPHATAVPGGTVAGQTNGVEAVTAILALNALVGNLGQNGTAFTLTPPAVDPMLAPTAVSSYSDVKALIDRMNSGGVDVLLVQGNPRHELPLETKFVEAIGKVPFVVSFSSEPDETSLLSDLILPDHNYLESWGFQAVNPATDRLMVTGQQPVVLPLYDTRATSDVILAIAQSLGGAVKTALPYPNTLEYLKTAVAKLAGQSALYDTANGEKIWAGWRQYGGWWPMVEAPVYPNAAPSLPGGATVPPASYDGNPEQYPFLLYPYPSVTMGNGRGAASSWLQEAPDPMTTASWDTWVQINPNTAAQMGIQMDDVVKVISPHGSISAIAYLYPAIRPDVVAVPMGEGHIEFGRFAKNRGNNVTAILAPVTSKDGELAWGATRVSIVPLGRSRTLPRIENNTGVDAANADGVFPG